MADPRILLYNMKRINPLDLEPEDVDLSIAVRALSRLPRYSGQTKKTYRVAEHVVKLSEVVPSHLRRAALLHDTCEGFGLLDFANPVKRTMPAYSELEARMLRVIFKKYDVPWELMEELDQFDRRICQDEMMQVFIEPYDMGLEPLGITVEFWSERTCWFMLHDAFKAEGLIR